MYAWGQKGMADHAGLIMQCFGVLKEKETLSKV